MTSHSQALAAELMTEIEGIRHQALEASEVLTERLRNDPVIQNGIRSRMLALVGEHDSVAQRCTDLMALVHREFGG